MAQYGAATCPHCGSTNSRSAWPRGIRELALSLADFYAFVCRDCSRRFMARPFLAKDVVYAKCPRCLRQDLTVWDPQHYHASFGIELAVTLGGNRWRCEPCRCNFVSWLPRRSRYTRNLLPASQPPQTQS